MESSDEINMFSERRADDLMIRGLAAVEDGDYISALHEFKASAFCLASSEALTHWGWMEHHLGDTDKAIDLCKRAITVEPEFGNPYNDIGSYLVASGRAEESVEWFEKAIHSKNYVPRQYPHINLGKVYLATDRVEQALFHFEQALALQPEDEDIRDLVDSLRIELQS